MLTLETDLTAAAIENRVLGEEHVLSNAAIRYIVPPNGFFYDKDLVIRNADTGTPLERINDYVLQSPSDIKRDLPYEAYLVIVITNPTVSRVLIDYRAVGGWYALTQTSIASILGTAINNGSVEFGDILNVPTEFYPAPHIHHARDVDWGSVIVMLDSLRQAISTGQGAALSSLYAYVNQMGNSFELLTDLSNPTWGAIREKITGFTINWGYMPEDTGPWAQGLTGARWETLFKKAFSGSGSPLIIPGGFSGKYLPYELESSSSDGFTHVVKYDSSSTATGTPSRWYIAIGLSSDATAISNTPQQSLV